MTHLEPFELMLIQFGLLVAASYAFAIFVYVKKPAYRSAVMKGVLLWAVLCILFGILWTADFLRGNSEVYEGLLGGLPLTFAVDPEMFRRPKPCAAGSPAGEDGKRVHFVLRPSLFMR